MRNFFGIIILVIILASVTVILIWIAYLSTPKPTPTPIVVAQPIILVSVTKEDLLVDIQQYAGISQATKVVIVDEIISVSKKYDINPIILYSLIHAESSFRFWITHREVTVVIDKKKIRTAAIGLSGIIWEHWGGKLVSANIVTDKSDLHYPKANIRSLGFIYDELYKMPMHSVAKSQDQSAMLRYFGGSYKSYVARIESKMTQLLCYKIYKKDVKK